ncbi:hypothetical protein Mal52_47640 [Symmachiella dynata]|uniref:Sialidase domain-containing protein n=1 Tax=Symmachiella dynata TaxID=2527995 RepID=A0A517ZUZ2_9PLAN|nr:sialidase family protein [Symmachiella dynata]QDU46246.1 hypothetical protein Mal52_47640 [Symmachiella dynata]
MSKTISLFLVIICGLTAAARAESKFAAEFVFPLNAEHNHAPAIVECPNGDLLASWYRGSGERSADDVRVLGARLRKGETKWSPEFLMADTPGFPDCNTAMMIDKDKKLWLFWPTILANTWESAVTNYMTSTDYEGEGAPRWDWKDQIYLKPQDFKDEFLDHVNNHLGNKQPLSKKQLGFLQLAKDTAGEKMYQRLGWMPRCKPTVLKSGRILMPLYTDTYSISIMAVSDDDGKTWYASGPIIDYGNIQPAVLQRDDGTVVAYMRENGFQENIRISESTDDGLTWGPVKNSALPNPGSGLDAVRLENGHWVMIYNDSTRDRNSLAVSLSEDEGRTWRWTRHLEQHEAGRYHYPAIIQAADGTIHAIYTYSVADGKTMKHAAFDEDWIKEGD